MLLPIRLVCSPKKIRRDGKSLIFIQYCFSAQNKTLLNTEVAIPPQYWNKKFQRISENLPAEFGIPVDLNKDLRRQLRIAEDIISHGIEQKIKDPVSFVKGVFYPQYDVSRLSKNNIKEGENIFNPDLHYQLDAYIESKRNRVAKATINVYNEMIRYLKAYEEFSGKKLKFESFDINFYDDFVNFLTYDYRSYRYKKSQASGLKVNTVGKAIKHLRIFLNERIRRKIIPPMDLSMFKSMEELADAIYLNKNEINQIALINLSHDKELEMHRDLFVLGCLTGLRFSDFSTIKSEDIREKTLYKKQQKSEHWVVIPLREQANHILNNKFNKIIPKISNSDFNASLKEIGKLAGLVELIKFSYKKGNRYIFVTKPKYGWITSHTCRRSFCTNEFLAGTPVELIMKISGHKSLKDFYRYIKISPEEAAEKIKDIWYKRGEMPKPTS